MSIITNEIHVLDGFKKTLIISAGDRWLTRLDGSFDSLKPKVIHIPYLDSYISYFGLAAIVRASKKIYLADWLSTFIRNNSQHNRLEDFSVALQEELNRTIPSNILQKNPSGFHICGYNAAGLPEFWYLSNIGGMDQFSYTNLQGKYGKPHEDFLSRDAAKIGWDGVNRESVQNVIQFYRNGDIRSHAYAWGKLDGVLNDMLKFPDIKQIRTPTDIKKWVEFKLKFLASFHKQYSIKPTIGTPIDVHVLSRGF